MAESASDRQTLLLYGAGAQLVIDFEETCLRLGWRCLGVRNVAGPTFSRAEATVGVDELTAAQKAASFLIPVFSPEGRRAALGDALSRGLSMPATLLDPTAVVSSSATFGRGSYVNAGSVIGGATTVGEFSIVNRAVSIGHHCRIDDFVSIGPGATLAGRVRVRYGAVIGAGAVILPDVDIGANANVGAGSVVTRNVPAGAVVYGNPARLVQP